MKNLYELFIKEEATQVEINPFVQTKDGKVFCVDAKILFDDNAAFRHEDVFAQRDTSMEDSREVAASQFGLNYIGLDGNIGCMGQHARHTRSDMHVDIHTERSSDRYFFVSSIFFICPSFSAAL
jgi:succinyl-CoA synthetase beta subunit